MLPTQSLSKKNSSRYNFFLLCKTLHPKLKITDVKLLLYILMSMYCG